ncbi:MAG TPA: hypothetical protein VMF61_16765 [Candidatus Acidoferrales bacterium]|nr:hypothetical protein [Candidatus Acidoferrales bacterium]
MRSRREAFAALKAELSGAALGGLRVAVDAAVPSGIPELDRLLGGGVPRGTLVAMEGTAGAWSIAARLVAAVTSGALAAIIDDGGLYPPTLAQAGTRLERVLVVPARSPLGMARAADILLRSRACRLVLMTAPVLRAAVWSRLAALARRTGVVLIAVAAGAAAASLSAVAGLRLYCTRERLVVAGLRGLWSTVCGYVVRAELRKTAARASGAAASLRVVTGDRAAALRERDIPRPRIARAALR